MPYGSLISAACCDSPGRHDGEQRGRRHLGVQVQRQVRVQEEGVLGDDVHGLDGLGAALGDAGHHLGQAHVPAAQHQAERIRIRIRIIYLSTITKGPKAPLP